MKWARRFRRARRGEDYAPEGVSWLGLIALAPVIFALGFVYAYPRLKGPPLIRRDFAGRVVDKSLTLRESEIGTAALPRLLVEDGGGRRFNVAVSSEQYERARVGMSVRRRGGEVSLSWDEPARRAPAGGDDAVGR